MPNQTTKMKAVRIYEYGNADVLKYETADVPEISPDDVLIKVHYTSVNPMDWKLRAGYMKDFLPLKMPAILGIDVAGNIEKVGSNVKNFKVGDKVYSRADFSRGGSYAEYVAVNATQVGHAPNTIPLKEAAAMPVVFGTAYNAIVDIAKIRPGQKVLITGASGGVGSAAVQIAKSMGAYVIGTTSKPNMDMVKSLGADEVIDYTDGDFSKKVKDLDAVLDTVGGETLTKAYGTVRKNGILVTTAAQPDELIGKKYGITATGMRAKTDGARLDEIAKMVDSGKLKVVIDKEFPLSEIRAAHELSQSGRAKGKIILKVS